MHIRRLLAAAVALAAIAAAAGYWWSSRPVTVHYVTTPATIGTITRSITATGSVNPVITVQVGTYVSGTIQTLYCDYNTRVTAGQICAKIDPRPYQVVVDQAKANLASAKAQLVKDQAGLEYARVTFMRDAGLLKRGIVSQDSVDSDRSNFEQLRAQVDLDKTSIDQHDAALEAAQINLDYTNIISPVDGVVVSRAVDVGQTVAASFQTPTLFLIAQDLTKMQVDTNVAEADVGGARAGEKASFTVDAYPHVTFQGVVSQLRQAPITVQNVVTYDVVISVDNSDMRLLPGMTADARIVTAERTNALRVPVAALRFEPMAAAPGGTQPAAADNTGHVWILRNGQPVRLAVSTGIDDGTFAEVVSGDLKAGDAVIVDQIGGGAGGAAAPTRSPFRL